MPIFGYRCRECEHEFEYLLLHSSPPPTCPSCEGEDLEKLISAPSIRSDSTRRRSRRSARERGQKIRHEKQQEDHKQLHKHLKEDH